MILEDDVRDYLTKKQLNTFKEFNPKEMEDLNEWDNIPNIQIAIYLILINSKPKQKVKKITKKRNILKSRDEMIIRKIKSDIQANEFTWYSGDDECIYSEKVIKGVLGKFAKRFIPEHKIPLINDDEWKTKVREYKKENILLDKPRYLITEEDELTILKEFFEEAELYKDSISAKYLEYKKVNHNNTGKMLTKKIDNDIKKILAKRLAAIGTTNKKIDSLCSRAIKAIKDNYLT